MDRRAASFNSNYFGVSLISLFEVEVFVELLNWLLELNIMNVNIFIFLAATSRIRGN